MTERSAIDIVDRLIHQAISQKASDIHLESQPHTLRVRFRLDGLLQDREPILLSHAPQVIARIKVLAHLDIAQRRVAQDGKYRINSNGRDIDIRISTFPGIHGEKVVLRILDGGSGIIPFDGLGLPHEMNQELEKIMKKAQGFFLVTGPTGSGKTTTLYAAINRINTPEKNIMTLEDPVEYGVNGINQSQIHPIAGFTFAHGIRAMLRQDPDVILIGEIRDKETARIAIEASLTGHLVLSTVHTNNAASVIMRLMDMDVEPFLINAALSGVLAQRLVRTICSDCKEIKKIDAHDEAILKQLRIPVTTVYHGAGCTKCFNTGYRGRIGIFELLNVSDALRSLIIKHPSFAAIEKQCISDGMRTLYDDARQKLNTGVVSLAEIARVLL